MTIASDLSFMTAMLYFSVFVLGLVIGSFLNVYIIRLNTGKDTKGRSACASCGNPLAYFELVPILSFLFLKGRCLKCKGKISVQYPLVELGNALLYLLIFLMTESVWLAIALLPLASLTVAMSVYDIKHKIIPQVLLNFTAVNTLAFLFLSFYLHGIYLQDLILRVLLNELVYAMPIFLIWLISSGRAMGFADVKLTAILAPLFLSPSVAWFALSASFVLGALFAVSLIVFSRFLGKNHSISIKSEIAFGPFILLSFWIFMLFPIYLF